MRHAEYQANPTVPAELPLRGDADLIGTTKDEVLAAWTSYLGRDLPLMLVKNTDRARKLLIQAYGVEEGERIGVPVNCRRALSESVKKANRNTPHFIELDADLGFAMDTPGLHEFRLHWSQPVGGMPSPQPIEGKTLFVDYSFTLPAPPFAEDQGLTGAATIWGLHLSETTSEAGALVAFSDTALYDRVLEIFEPDEDLPDLDRALAQCRRLDGEDGLAARTIRAYQDARFGMEIGAGLPMSPLVGMCALPHGVAVRVPDEADLPTFISYGRNELVPVDWFPEIQPIFYVGFQVTRDKAMTRRSAEHLSRWLVSPLGPDFLDEEVVHAVLVMVKAAEYTGVRWYTDPDRARWYNDLMLEWYGPTHDAYRMAFAPSEASRQVALKHD
ncbi:hypothetical protein BH23CHL2_BH23CHL2_27360 [soil metagenome]